MKFVVKQTPEAKWAEENPLVGLKKRNDDGQTVEYPALLRDPVTSEERKLVRELWKNNIDAVRRRLAKKDCPVCHGKGSYDVSDYPGDPMYYKLMHAEICGCFMED
jgi:hypothetical protein